MKVQLHHMRLQRITDAAGTSCVWHSTGYTTWMAIRCVENNGTARADSAPLRKRHRCCTCCCHHDVHTVVLSAWLRYSGKLCTVTHLSSPSHVEPLVCTLNNFSPNLAAALLGGVVFVGGQDTTESCGSRAVSLVSAVAWWQQQQQQ